MKNHTSAFAIALALTLSLILTVPSKAEGLKVSQTSATIGVKQSISLISINGSRLKVSSNSSAVKASVYGGNQITILGKKAGKAVVTVCDDTLGCAPISITVQKKKVAPFSIQKNKITLKAGQYLAINSSNGKDLIAFSNSGAVEAWTNDKHIALTGKYPGKSTVTVCTSNLGCLPVFVTVAGYVNNNTNGYKTPSTSSQVNPLLPLSQNSVSTYNGQTADVFVLNNAAIKSALSNSIVARSAVNGNRITVYGTYTGTATITVCDYSNNCSPIYVTVLPTPARPTLNLSQTSVSIYPTQSVTIYSSNGVDLRATPSSDAVTTVNSSNQVTITGSHSGNTTVTICSLNVGCASVPVTVKNPSSSQLTKNVSLALGQTKTIQLTSQSTIYKVLSNSNSHIVAHSISGSFLTLQGLNIGKATVVVCPADFSFGCETIYASVGNNISLSMRDLTVGVGQSTTIAIFGSGPFTIFSNANSNAVSAFVNSNVLTIKGENAGSSTVTVCQNDGACDSVLVNVQ